MTIILQWKYDPYQLVWYQIIILLIYLLNSYYLFNHNYIKILESDWSSAGLISAVIV